MEERTQNPTSTSKIAHQRTPFRPPRPLGASWSPGGRARGPRERETKRTERPRRTTRGVRAASATPRSGPRAAPERTRRPSKSGGTASQTQRAPRHRPPDEPPPRCRRPKEPRPRHNVGCPGRPPPRPAEHKNGGPAPTAAPRSKEEAAPVHAARDGRGRPDPVRRRAGSLAAGRYGSVGDEGRDSTGSQDRTGCARSGPGLCF